MAGKKSDYTYNRRTGFRSTLSEARRQVRIKSDVKEITRDKKRSTRPNPTRARVLLLI